MLKVSDVLLSWFSQIFPKPTARKILIISISILFSIWFMLILSPRTSYLQGPIHATHRAKFRYQQNCISPPPPSPFNDSKIALLIEDRPITHLAPLLLHMISVVPPEWRFVFLGSSESIAFLNNSLPVQMQVLSGKLDMRYIPSNFSVNGQEPLSQTMTNIYFWKWLGGADRWRWEDPFLKDTDEDYNNNNGDGKRRPQVEWVLVFQSDSILCANSKVSLNDWLHYDWVGAPWSIKDRYGGNGGLSLRRVSRIIQVLQFQHRYPGHYEMEDLWLIQRIGVLPGARMANATTESTFSVEQIWSEEPMGYHLGGSGKLLPAGVWIDRRQREKIWKWCPEIKLILKMDLVMGPVLEFEDYPGGRNNRLKHGGGERVGKEERGINKEGDWEDWRRLKAW